MSDDLTFWIGLSLTIAGVCVCAYLIVSWECRGFRVTGYETFMSGTTCYAKTDKGVVPARLVFFRSAVDVVVEK